MSRLLRISIWVVILGGLLAFGLYLGDRVKSDPGYVLFAYGGYTAEMSLWALLFFLLSSPLSSGLYLAWVVLWAVFL